MWTDGFLGYRTSFMLDFVVCALLVIVPVLTYSICLVRFRRHYNLHRKVQTVLCIVLFIAVGAFEVDLQIVHGGWENVVAKSFDDIEDLLGSAVALATSRVCGQHATAVDCDSGSCSSPVSVSTCAGCAQPYSSAPGLVFSTRCFAHGGHGADLLLRRICAGIGDCMLGEARWGTFRPHLRRAGRRSPTVP